MKHACNGGDRREGDRCKETKRTTQGEKVKKGNLDGDYACSVRVSWLLMKRCGSKRVEMLGINRDCLFREDKKCGETCNQKRHNRIKGTVEFNEERIVRGGRRRRK